MLSLDDLKRKLAARTNVPGYERNVEELKRAIAELEASTNANNDSK